MQIHQVKRDPRLQIPVDLVQLDRPSNIDNLTPGQMLFVQRLIDFLILGDSRSKIFLRIFLTLSSIIRITGSSFEGDVLRNDFGIIAPALEKNDLETWFSGYSVCDLLSM